MGLRKRTTVNNASPSAAASSPSSSVSSPTKRSRSENNNSPSHGNLNSSETSDSPPPPKRSRSSKASTSAFTKVTPSKRGSKSNSKASASATSSDLESLTKTTNGNWTEPRPPYSTVSSMSGLCSDNIGLTSSIPYMSSTMATYVGTATNLGKNPSVSYLDISNMTGNGYPNSSEATKTASFTSPQYSKPEAKPSAGPVQPEVPTLPSEFPNDAMFAVYQPWVIKTYGDLAKTKTITIKKYARILRTLRGEEINSAENSKFRFWVKSKGFHIGQPEDYDAKPADRIIGRHAVTSPGLDPPLYVPTQVPHNKSVNSVDRSAVPIKVYKKVAIVENFFDIIHAVHVDLEGRPGKHAGQKRTYRTITETYAFLPREAVTRFLLGCTECQRRPRSPSPALSKPITINQTPANTMPTVPAITLSAPSTTTANITNNLSPPLVKTAPLAPTPVTPPSAPPVELKPKPVEVSHPSECKSLINYRHNKTKQCSKKLSSPSPAPDTISLNDLPVSVASQASLSPSTPIKSPESPAANLTESLPSTISSQSSPVINKSPEKENKRDEKYNPLSIINLLKKDHPNSKYGCNIEELDGTSDYDSLKSNSPDLKQEESKENVPNLSCTKRKLILREDRSLSPLSTVPVSRPWSPGVDTKTTPIDYSLPITTSYLKYYQRIQAEKEREMEAKFLEEIRLRQRILSFESMADCRRLPNTPSELIGTNLNLLTTIQQLHYQVMVALNDRLRYSSSNTSMELENTLELENVPKSSISTTTPLASRGSSSFMLYPGVHIPISPDT